MKRRIVGTIFAATLASCVSGLGFAQTVDELVARNVAARGGAKAWKAVSSLRLTGRMNVGQGVLVPYVLDQKRPSKMCLEFVFDGGTAVQCSDGKSGWKVMPFRGRTKPEPMTEIELREAASSSDPSGLLFDHSARGHAVELLGREPALGKNVFKLKVTLPGGAVRWVYLDGETGLELKVEAQRTIGGVERRVETLYQDWKAAGGLLIPRRYETKTDGAKDTQFLTVETVLVNPAMDDARFVMPVAAVAGIAGGK